MATVTIKALTNLPQFGLKHDEIGEVDADLAAGPIARSFAAIIKPGKKNDPAPETPPAA